MILFVPMFSSSQSKHTGVYASPLFRDRLTNDELSSLFASVGLRFQYMQQGQIPKYGKQYPLVEELSVEHGSINREVLLMKMEQALADHCAPLAGKEAFTYGGSIIEHEKGKVTLELTVAIAV